MKKVIFTGLIVIFMAGCAGAPPPKKPDERNRVPVNTSVPDEIKNGQVPRMNKRGEA
ncbi:TrwH protein [Vibrio parahaemolyticus]|nr:TrwH protein [Vibrio parahaemolyticus]